MAGFSAATAVERTGESYRAELDPAWSIGTKPNGGYLLAVLARAAVDTAGPEHPHPNVVSGHFLAAPPAGPAELRVQPLRTGRSAAQLRVGLFADGQHCVEALVTCGPLPPASAPWWSGVAPVELPPEDACMLMPAEHPQFSMPLWSVLAERLDPGCLGFAAGQPAGQGELRGWLRLADGTEPDPLALLVAADCLPPATLDLGLTSSWVPTVELTVHVRALPTPGPLRVRQRVRQVAAGRVDEECDVWDSTGALVATGHQLAAIRLPAEAAASRAGEAAG